MSITEHFSVVGTIEFTKIEKNGHIKFARIRPTYYSSDDGWEATDGHDFPSEGYVFWHAPDRADNVTAGMVVQVAVSDGRSGTDRFHLRGLISHMYEVLDHSSLPYWDALDQFQKLEGADHVEVFEVFIRCRDDILLGPLAARRLKNGRLAVRYRSREVPTLQESRDNEFVIGDRAYLPASVAARTRTYLDCGTADEVAEAVMNDLTVTLASVESTGLDVEAWARKAATLSRTRIGDLQRKRIDRVLAAGYDTAANMRLLRSLISKTLDSQKYQDELKHAKEEALAAARREADAESATRIEAARQEGEEIRRATRIAEEELRAVEADLDERRGELQRAIKNQEAELDAQTAELRDRAALDRAAIEQRLAEDLASLEGAARDRAADVMLLRALQRHDPTPMAAKTKASSPLRPFALRKGAGGDTRSRVRELRGSVHRYKRALLLVRSAIDAGLFPVIAGPDAMLIAREYASWFLGSRMATISVPHDMLAPIDMLGIRSHALAEDRPFGDLLHAANEQVAEEHYGGLIVLDQFNQSPSESYLLPWLRSGQQIEIPFGLRGTRPALAADFAPAPSLEFLATSTTGPSTSAVSPELWDHAVVIDTFSAAESAPSLAHTASWSALKIDGLSSTTVQTAERFEANTPKRRFAAIECALMPPVSTFPDVAQRRRAVETIAVWSGINGKQHRDRLLEIVERHRGRFA